MEWTRSETLVLAMSGCTACHGLGLLIGKRGKINPCNCVLRAIFRACYKRFRRCVTKEKHMTRVTMNLTRGRERHFTWGRKDEEYIADFILVTRRTLNEQEYKLFNLHYLLGADWKLCCRKLKTSRGNCFHAIYRIQNKLGRVFRELEPYSLYPLDEYFNSSSREVKAIEVSQSTAYPKPIRPQLKLAA